MPNYSLRLRPRYGPDELTGGERISQGIGQALSTYVNYQDQQRDERNKVAAMGGQPVDEGAEPGVMGRLRGIGSAIKRRLQGDPTVTGLQTGTDTERDALTPVMQQGAPLPTQPTGAFRPNTRDLNPIQSPAARAPFTPQLNDLNPRGGAPAGRGPFSPQLGFMPGGLTPNDGRQPFDEQPPVGQQSPIPPVPETAMPKGGRATRIADAIAPYIYEGRGGQKYRVDPMYQQRVALAGQEMGADAAEARQIAAEGRQQATAVATEQRHTATMRAQQAEQVQALVDAGMPPGEARARVLNNVVRYDDEFGQPRTQQLTYEQRVNLERMREENARKVAQLRASGQTNTDAYHQAMLAISTANLVLNTGQMRAAGFDKQATTAGGTIPKDPIARSIMQSQPGGAAQITKAESTVAADQDSAERIRAETAARTDSIARGIPPIVRPGASRPDDTGTGGKLKFSVEQARARAQALRAAHKTPWETYRQMKAEGYNVAPPRTPEQPDTGNIHLRR